LPNASGTGGADTNDVVYRVIAAVRSPFFGEIRLLVGYGSVLEEYICT
jgi:hypothetical protein